MSPMEKKAKSWWMETTDRVCKETIMFLVSASNVTMNLHEKSVPQMSAALALACDREARLAGMNSDLVEGFAKLKGWDEGAAREDELADSVAEINASLERHVMGEVTKVVMLSDDASEDLVSFTKRLALSKSLRGAVGGGTGEAWKAFRFLLFKDKESGQMGFQEWGALAEAWELSRVCSKGASRKRRRKI